MVPIIVNFVYAITGGLITLAFMGLAYFIFDRLTSFDISRELVKGNRAVGSMVMGLFIGIGIAVGLVVGLSLN